MSGGVRPQRLARQRSSLLWPTDSAPFRGRTPPRRAPDPPTGQTALRAPPPNPHRPPQAPAGTPRTYATSQSSTPANSFPFTSSGAADPRTD
ncbi:hypothetical protein GCM10010348_57090 [Streptomyces anthocyanicus]|uniref:Uncharacterized protein n=1 Tax=Streptomyces violaceolatus TaxID=67378 RepID=A0ABN3T1U5_9ACTN|nr:hypothetical protein GCM10010348_57090 [Streptomyces anthocyanicus]